MINIIKTLKPYNLVYSNTTATKIGSLPANGLMTNIRVLVGTAFNAPGTDYLDIGDDTTADKFASNVDLSSTGVATATMLNTGAVLSASAPTDIYITFTPGTSACTTGSAYIVVEYVQL